VCLFSLEHWRPLETSEFISCRWGGQGGAHGVGGALDIWRLLGWSNFVLFLRSVHALDIFLLDVFTLDLIMCHLLSE